jgi:hypothetical protein
MLHSHRKLVLVAALAPLLSTGLSGAEPLFTLTDGGTTFLYRSRPGDLPARVAEMFGVAPSDLPALLRANGITDATRVGPEFVYRIPNQAARNLAERTARLEADGARLERELAEAQERSRTSLREAEEARAAAARAEARAARAARLETLWPVAQGVALVLMLLAGAAAAVALAASRRQRQAERYAHSLSAELEEKRKAGLLERQESARRILEFETRTRQLEAQLGPRAIVGGRS